MTATRKPVLQYSGVVLEQPLILLAFCADIKAESILMKSPIQSCFRLSN
jgi:hypothetical protein